MVGIRCFVFYRDDLVVLFLFNLFYQITIFLFVLNRSKSTGQMRKSEINIGQDKISFCLNSN